MIVYLRLGSKSKFWDSCKFSLGKRLMYKFGISAFLSLVVVAGASQAATLDNGNFDLVDSRTGIWGAMH